MKTPILKDTDAGRIEQLKAYYINAINKELQNCNELQLLDFILKLMISRNRKS